MTHQIEALPGMGACQTIMIGNFSKVHDLRKALNDLSVGIDLHASNILNKVDVVKNPQSIELVFVTNRELGFTFGARLRDVSLKAKERGFRPCPEEVGPQLCIQGDLTLCKGGVVPITRPLVGFHSQQRHLFQSVVNEDLRVLLVVSGEYDAFFDPGVTFVFTR